jgi:hypothetical protein
LVKPVALVFTLQKNNSEGNLNFERASLKLKKAIKSKEKKKEAEREEAHRKKRGGGGLARAVTEIIKIRGNLNF